MTIGRPRRKRLRFWDKGMDPIAPSLNTRPRARHQFQSPLEVYKRTATIFRHLYRYHHQLLLRLDLEAAK